MTDQIRPTFWQRSFIGKTWHWFFRRANMRRTGLAFVWFVTSIALFYAIVDWYGAQEWNAFRIQHEKSIGPLSFSNYIPRAIPDSENFAASPSATAWITQWRGTNHLFEKDAVSKAEKLMNYNSRRKKSFHRTFTDLVGWSNAFTEDLSPTNYGKPSYSADQSIERRAQAAPAIFAGLQEDQDLIKEFRLASDRTFSRYPVFYSLESPWETLLPHLARIKQTCQRLQLQTSAELVLGENQKAFEDVNLIFYLANSIQTEPVLISYLVRVACLHIGIEAIWEGLAQNRWNDVQLRNFDEALSHYTLISDTRLPFRGEEGMGVAMLNLIARDPVRALSGLDNINGLSSKLATTTVYIFFKLYPSGWLNLEKLHFCQTYDKGTGNLTDNSGTRIFPEKIKAPQGLGSVPPNNLWQNFFNHTLFLKWLYTPAITKFMEKAAAAQVDVDQARLACVLERYHLAHASYPSTLNELAPQFMEHLPDDPITGNSYIYKAGHNGRYMLYSVGWDEKDDGGKTGQTQFGNTNDWVWEYPTNR